MSGKRKAVAASVARKKVPEVQAHHGEDHVEQPGPDVPAAPEAVPELRDGGGHAGDPGHAGAPAGDQEHQEAGGLPDVAAGSTGIVWREERRPAGALVEWDRNPRLITHKQAGDLYQSLKTFGIVEPLVVNADGASLIGGHQRLKVLLQKGLIKPNDLVPVRVPSRPLNHEEFEELAIRLNRNTGDWDWDRLANEFDEVKLVDWGFKPEEFGIEDPRLGASQPTEPSAPIEVKAEETIRVKKGDVWIIGDNDSRFICGDASDPKVISELIENNKIDFVFTAPPTSEHTKLDMEKHLEFLAQVVDNLKQHMPVGRCIGWSVGTSPKSSPHLQFAMLDEAGFTYLRQIVWKKVGVAIPQWYRTKDQSRARYLTPDYMHDVIGLFSLGEIHYGAPVKFDETLMHDVFEMVSASPLQIDTKNKKKGDLILDTASFPTRLPAAFIQHMSDEDTIVFDPFLGTGTTLLAAESLGRCGLGVEVDPRFCEVILRRAERLHMKVRKL